VGPNVEDYEDDVVALLSELIRVDTSNPPGNETAAALVVDAFFRRHGLEGELVGESPERQNFVLRLDGSRPGPTLLLLAHLDVVPAPEPDWSAPPFAGEVRDGYVWGRGAADIKNLVAANAVAVARLAATGGDFAGAVVYAATADEEVGTACGARWLLEHRPDLVACDFVLNEGGGEFQVVDGRRVYPMPTGEKGTAQFRLVVTGTAGHASMPMYEGNAVADAARVVEALLAHRPRVVMDSVSPTYIRAMVADEATAAALLDADTARAALEELRRHDGSLARLLEPQYGVTLAPTGIRSHGAAVNAYPARVDVTVDCRTLPGQGPDDVLSEVTRALAGVEADWSLEWIDVIAGNSSPYPSELGAAVDSVMRRLVPDATVAPVTWVGFTDSKWFRDALPSCIAYGFSPYLLDDRAAVMARFHGVDERIAVRDLHFQTLFREELLRELLGAGRGAATTDADR